MTEPKTIVRTHYDRPRGGKAIFMREGLRRQLERRSREDLNFIREHVVTLRDGPFKVEYEKLSYRIAADLYVLWSGGFYFLYRVHKPSTGPFAGFEWVVHILDIDGFRLDEDGNRILDIYHDPDAMRTLAERDGGIMPDPEGDGPPAP